MTTKKATKDQAVVVRTYSAGVHFGYLAAREGKEVTLKNARRIWRWNGANTLNEIALRGVEVARSRISEPVATITLTEAIEIIGATPEATKNLESGRWAQ